MCVCVCVLLLKFFGSRYLPNDSCKGPSHIRRVELFFLRLALSMSLLVACATSSCSPSFILSFSCIRRFVGSSTVCYALTYNNVLPTVKQNDGIGLKQFFSNAATLQALQYSKLTRRIDMFWHEETSKSYTYSIQSI